MMQCEWTNTGSLLRCLRCGRTIDPEVFDVPTAGQCRSWFASTSAQAAPQRPRTGSPFVMQGPPPHKLAVIACYYNFAGYRSLRENYLRFLHEMDHWDVPLFVAELAIDDQPFVRDPFLRLRVSGDRHCVWQKEALLNRIVAELPESYDAVAWVDADMIFLDRQWYRRTLAALAEFPVVQMWDEWNFSDHRGKVVLTGQSVGHLGSRFRIGKGHPGGAWAARRDVFPLYDLHILGGGDTAAADAWLGLQDTFLQQHMPPAWHAQFRAWADTAWQKVQGQVTTLPGDCLHLYHGSRENRRYGERSRWLLQHQFDPDAHITRDREGLLCWTNAAPAELRETVRQYFTDRAEDEGLS